MNKPTLTVILLLLSVSSRVTAQADTSAIRKHMLWLTQHEINRDFSDTAVLNKTAAYIYTHFARYADSVYYQAYTVKGKSYKNVVGVFYGKDAKKIIVGAHYDVCGHQPGADDNASGVTGLLELARLLDRDTFVHTIELVAFTLEEPPYFRTEQMGSYIHARSLHESKAEVAGMICLEMIGYFADARNTQSYPLGVLKLVYGSRGNYITLVKKTASGKFARKFSRTFKNKRQLRTRKFTAPASLPGIDFSDHLNYWKFGYSALMITDTAFYRNRNYHKPGDTVEKLDLNRMSLVINSVYSALAAY